MATHRVGIIMHGATGGLARKQHVGALAAIRKEGGLPLPSGDVLMPDPIFVGRSAERLAALVDEVGFGRTGTDLAAALENAEDTVFFDAAATALRFDVLSKAIDAGKHIYCEKPIAGSTAQAMELVHRAEKAGVKHGTVQDKMFLPGFANLEMVTRSGFLGRILEVRLEMGRWIFDGTLQDGGRPSWNYQSAGGGGLILDMFPHWRYMLEGLIGPLAAISCRWRTQIPRRVDEAGRPYDVDVEDCVFAQVEFENGVIGSVNSSWTTRPRRDAAIVVQIDGTEGSAVAGPQICYTQAGVNSRRFKPSADSPTPEDFYDDWQPVPQNTAPRNGYRMGWERFLRYVAAGDDAYPYSLRQGVKGVQLAELAYRSHEERRWIDIPALA
ncbi:Gfo/Idh/MocA family oxidoreductase [Ancylobacter sp. MQZ15Z-1]|uniref:Gfo/Idh/MocA family oxidoreductase n=1 Tax=Ancylobacter mangrovi TaxID=2972472 RepID=A0A9X2P9W5_9HYPH|nr:Gfo/Idh/MocA family oxidoreductase [Ancylobacter mangrovi]MCS0494759.1 Gfo/Idh/MocA family oxidoreductase [Ancylobacter mangrovi]